MNEVFAEADSESLDAHVAAWGTPSGDEAFINLFRALLAHTVPGAVHDYPLEPIDLS